MTSMTPSVAVVALEVALVPVEMLSTPALMFVPVVRGAGRRLRTGFSV